MTIRNKIDISINDFYWFNINIIKHEQSYTKFYIDEPRTGFGNDELKLEKFITINGMSEYVSDNFTFKKVIEDKLIYFIYKFQQEFPKAELTIKGSDMVATSLKLMNTLKGDIKKYKVIKDFNNLAN